MVDRDPVQLKFKYNGNAKRTGFFFLLSSHLAQKKELLFLLAGKLGQNRA